MNKQLLFGCLLITAISINAQVAPTVGDVYNFDPGDEFHYRSPLAPPNASRMLILTKYYSALNDTVFYIRQNDNYGATVVWGPQPYLVYNTSSYIDTVYYTNLTDPVIVPAFSPDSCNTQQDSLYMSAAYCGAQVYEYNACINCCFESNSYGIAYGVGLGLLVFDNQNTGNISHQRTEQIYYHKAVSGDSCGTADRTYYAGLKETKYDSKLLVYPNPANDLLTIRTEENLPESSSWQIVNLLGTVMCEGSIRDKQTVVHLEHLPAGVYFVKVGHGIKRIIKQ
jgi:hypothetical protein